MGPTLDVEGGVVPWCVNKRRRGTLGGVGGTLDGVGWTWAPIGGLPMLVWGTLVVPFPLTAGLPLVGSIPCHANSPSGLRETAPT